MLIRNTYLFLFDFCSSSELELCSLSELDELFFFAAFDGFINFFTEFTVSLKSQSQFEIQEGNTYLNSRSFRTFCCSAMLLRRTSSMVKLN